LKNAYPSRTLTTLNNVAWLTYNC